MGRLAVVAVVLSLCATAACVEDDAPDVDEAPDVDAAPNQTLADIDEVDRLAASPGCEPYFETGGAGAKWVTIDDNGNLAYRKLDSKGDRIMDFSHAGYRGGGVALPTATVRKTVSPSGGDDTAAIQAAIDEVSQRTLTGGLRGAVKLGAGTFKVGGTLHITKSGVVLRGSGSGSGGTVVNVTGGSHRFLEISGSGNRSVPSSPKTTITDGYVGSGSRSFHVASAAGFAVGDPVLVGRPVTAPWIALLGMDDLVRNGQPQTWIKAGTVHTWERTITAISGTKVTIDVPLSDSLDSTYVKPPSATLTRYTFSGRIENVGLEKLRVVSPPRSAEVEMSFVKMSKVLDGWVRDVTAKNFTNGLSIESGSRRITVTDVDLTHDAVDFFTAAAPADFSVNAEQVLVMRSSSTGGNKIFYYVTHSTRGPNAVLDFDASGSHSHFEPHQRWATGLLVDRAHLGGGIGFANRGTAGSGHGWTIGWGVVWNCEASTKVLAPPGATNWAIGCIGGVSAPGSTPGMPGSPTLAQGEYYSQGTHVKPDSLYLAQLCQRKGPAAVEAIGY